MKINERWKFRSWAVGVLGVLLVSWGVGLVWHPSLEDKIFYLSEYLIFLGAFAFVGLLIEIERARKSLQDQIDRIEQKLDAISEQRR